MVKNIPDMVLRLNKNADKNGGMFVMKGDKKGIWLNVDKNNARAGNEMSASEAYVHELIHAMVEYAKEDNSAEIAGYLAQIMNIREKAMKVLTVEDLMPDVSVDKELEEKIAQSRLDYFSSKDGLSEFMAYSMTNEKVIAKLKTIDVYSRKDRKNQRAQTDAKAKRKERSVVANAFEAIGEIIKTIMEVLVATARKETINAKTDKTMFKLVERISRMNNRALVAKRGTGAISGTLGSARQKLDAVNEFVHKWLTKIVEIGDDEAIEIIEEMHKEAVRLKERGGFLGKSWFVAKNTARMFRNKTMFNAYMSVLNSMGMRRNGFVQMIIKGFRKKDDLEKKLERLGLISNKVDQSVENIALAHGQMVLDGFKDHPSKEEQIIMTEGLVAADMQAIADAYTDEELSELYSDEDARNKEIERVREKLLKYADGTYYVSQAAGLGAMMAIGQGSVSQLQNAEAIAAELNVGVGASKFHDNMPTIPKSGDKALVQLIDELASLESIRYMDGSVRTGVAAMIDKDAEGVRNLIAMHKVFVADSKARLFHGYDWVLEKKGFTKSIDSTHDRVRLSGNPESDSWFDSQGYDRVRGDNPDDLKIYYTDFDPQAKYNTAAMRFTDIHSKTNTLENVSYTGFDSLDVKAVKRKKDKYAMITQAQIIKMREGIVEPVVEGNENISVVPIMTPMGQVKTYQYVLNKKLKAELRGQDRGVAHVMGRMFASVDDKVQSKEINKEIGGLLIKEAAKNKDMIYGIGSDLNDYVEFSEENEDLDINNIYRMLPDDVRNMIKKYEETTGRKLMVRADLLNNYFGFRSMSVSNSKLAKMMGPQVQKAIRMAGVYWVDAVKITKVDYVMRMPNTFAQNVISNFNLSMAMGMSP
ncbi:MAG: hypothetical protein U9N61_08035, partial [Euryarchaeota archaeon]|nr:hypothetical protein [Euryarchaeota archaeon]